MLNQLQLIGILYFLVFSSMIREEHVFLSWGVKVDLFGSK